MSLGKTQGMTAAGPWPGRLAVAALFAAAVLELPARELVAQGDEAAILEAAERDLEGLVWLRGEGLEILFRPPAADPNRQRRQQIEQLTRQLEQTLRPILAGELEVIRQACGTLDSAARRAILAAGRAATAQAARGFAERQLTGRIGQDGFDPRQEIRAGLVTAVRAATGPDEFAAYQQARDLQAARLAAAARLRILAKLDHQLDLSAAQRTAIEADLERQWMAAWLPVLTEPGGLVNNLPAAPDYAKDAIEPHLTAGQKLAWETWCRAAGSRIVGQRSRWSFDGSGLQQLDGWWEK